jgi:hypothetical protein
MGGVFGAFVTLQISAKIVSIIVGRADPLNTWRIGQRDASFVGATSQTPIAKLLTDSWPISRSA